jgi:hypothetical protein
VGKLSLRARRERDDRAAAGLPPYVVTKGSGSKIAPVPPATGHPGSKRGFPRLTVVTDTQGRRRVIWPKRKRRGAQASAMSTDARIANYRRQNGKRRGPTPAQDRRIQHKAGRAMSREGS